MKFTMRFSFKLSTVDGKGQMVTFAYKNTALPIEADTLLEAQDVAWKTAVAEALRQSRMEMLAFGKAVNLSEVRVSSLKPEVQK